MNATSGYTVAKSPTSVNDVISVFLGQTDYSDTNGCAKDASPRLLMGSFLYRGGALGGGNDKESLLKGMTCALTSHHHSL